MLIKQSNIKTAKKRGGGVTRAGDSGPLKQKIQKRHNPPIVAWVHRLSAEAAMELSFRGKATSPWKLPIKATVEGVPHFSPPGVLALTLATRVSASVPH